MTEKNSEATRQDGKTTCGICQKTTCRKPPHLAGTSQLGNAAKTACQPIQREDPSKIARPRGARPEQTEEENGARPTASTASRSHRATEPSRASEGTRQPGTTRRPPRAATRKTTNSKPETNCTSRSKAAEGRSTTTGPRDKDREPRGRPLSKPHSAQEK